MEISRIDVLVEKSTLLLIKCKSNPPDFFDLNAIGSILHSFYNGLESIFKLIHKACDNSVFSSGMWHSELFHSMFEQTDARPPVLDQSLLPTLKDYLGFRHVFRHSYGYELDWERLEPLFTEMSHIWNEIKICIKNFTEL